MQRIEGTDLFEWHGRAGIIPDRYRLVWTDAWGNTHLNYDPYCFPPQLSDYDIYLFGEGHHWHAIQIARPSVVFDESNDVSLFVPSKF